MIQLIKESESVTNIPALALATAATNGDVSPSPLTPAPPPLEEDLIEARMSQVLCHSFMGNSNAEVTR
jgi:hypothetical protein